MKDIKANCDYCRRPIQLELDVCNICIRNMREICKHPKLQRLVLDKYVLKNVVVLE